MTNFYVRCGDDAEALARVYAHYPDAVIDPPSTFASISVSDGENVNEATVMDVAERLRAEVIFLGFASSTDSFAYTHCVYDRCVRHLRYGWEKEERWWESVEGEPEDWEHAAFFDEQQLEDMEALDPMRERVEAMFRRGRVRAGMGWPIIDAREAARAVAVYFRLTDWLDDWAEPVSARRETVAPSGSVIAITGVPERDQSEPTTPDADTETSEPTPHPVEPPVESPADSPDERAKRPWWRFW